MHGRLEFAFFNSIFNGVVSNINYFNRKRVYYSHFSMHHLIFEINFLLHSINLVLISLLPILLIPSTWVHLSHYHQPIQMGLASSDLCACSQQQTMNHGPITKFGCGLQWNWWCCDPLAGVYRSTNSTRQMKREEWPSGKMSDCNARRREFKSRSGQNKFTKSDGQWWKIVNIYLVRFVLGLVCVRLWFLIVLYKLRHVWCVPSACIAA